MIVRHLEELKPARCVDTENWTSRRLLLARDGLGFSLHDTLIRAGTRNEMWYANHLEAVYCIAGHGSLRVVDTGGEFPIGPGTVYALDQHDKHVLIAETEMRMVCVFNPALAGPEVHDADGVYPLLSAVPAPGQAEPSSVSKGS